MNRRRAFMSFLYGGLTTISLLAGSCDGNAGDDVVAHYIFKALSPVDLTNLSALRPKWGAGYKVISLGLIEYPSKYEINVQGKCDNKSKIVVNMKEFFLQFQDCIEVMQ